MSDTAADGHVALVSPNNFVMPGGGSINITHTILMDLQQPSRWKCVQFVYDQGLPRWILEKRLVGYVVE